MLDLGWEKTPKSCGNTQSPPRASLLVLATLRSYFSTTTVYDSVEINTEIVLFFFFLNAIKCCFYYIVSTVRQTCPKK